MATSSLHWMGALAAHYRTARRLADGKPLMLLLDIDGTLLDMRHMVLSALQSYDAAHGTSWFQRLSVDDIDVHENQVGDLLQQLDLPAQAQEAVLAFYVQHRWSAESITGAHQPFPGVLELVRWFQIQPNTVVGLASGRPEKLRADTLRSLNELGRRHRVGFSTDLLVLNPGEWEEGVSGVKVAAVKQFREQGFHVFAFMDNEPDNLNAMAQAATTDDLLLLHADTIFESRRDQLPEGAVGGHAYRLDELIVETDLPPGVQLVWHGVNSRNNLEQFLGSEVQWAETDVMLVPGHSEVMVRHDTIAERPIAPSEELITLKEVVEGVAGAGKGLKIDLKGGATLLDRVLALVEDRGIEDEGLWFNADITAIGEAGFRTLASRHPGAITSCSVDFLAPLVLAASDAAHDVLKMLSGWGVKRFSMSWKEEELRADLRCVLLPMVDWGFDLNVYNVPDLEDFLQAVLLLPRSVTSDFNFPTWGCFGEGPGKGGEILTG
jgi:hypothetical protein